MCAKSKSAVLVSVLCGLIVVCSETVLALDPKKAVTQYVHDVWQTEAGLPQNSVVTILQTRDGYLWLGTMEGLVRFDGVRFTVFDKSNTKEIRNSVITALFEDREGNLWIGTGGGVIRFRDGRFSVLPTSAGLSGPSVTSIYEDSAGRLWIGARTGLIRFENRSFSVYTTKDGLGSNMVRALYEDRRGNLWVGTSAGLNRLREGRIDRFTRRDGLPADEVFSITEDRQGRLWIGTTGGLAQFGQGTFSVTTTKQGLSYDWVRSICEDRDGTLWIGTDGGGLNRLKEGTLTAFRARDGLSDDRVIAVYEDREGNLWVGTNGGGLNRLRDGKLTTYATEEGLSANIVSCIYEDRQGSTWIGTEGGLNRFRDGTFTAYTREDGLAHNRIRSLCEDKDGNLWIGTREGLSRYKDGVFTTYTTQTGLPSNVILALRGGRDGSLWIGTYGGGLTRLKRGRMTTFTMRDGLSSNRVLFITEDREGVLWLATDVGLNRFQQGHFTSYTTDDGLSGNFVLCVYEDDEGTLWIGTYEGGLNRFKNGTFTAYTMSDGLFNDVVYQILEDGDGNLWMSCNKGVFRVRKKALNDFADGRVDAVTSVAYGEADGMKSRECNGTTQPAGWKSRDGHLWFPTIEGVVVVDPEHLGVNRLPPPVRIEQVLVDKKPVVSTSGARFPPGEGELEFHYTALSLVDAAKARFKYRLEGFNQAWIEAGRRREAYYTNIPPGEYRFRVIASNNDGLWNEAGALFDVYLRPHFYQTTWFYALSAVGMLLTGWGVYQLRVKRFVAQTRALEAKVGERTVQLEQQKERLVNANDQLTRANEQLSRTKGQLERANGELKRANEELRSLNQEKADFLAIAAHDLRAPLVNLKGYVNELQSDLGIIRLATTAVWPTIEEAQRQEITTVLGQNVPEALAFIDSSAGRMDKLVEAILKLSRLGRRELQPELVNVRELVEAALKTLSYQIEQQQVKVRVGAVPEVVADRTSMELIMENLLANAVKYLDPDRRGKIEITGRREEYETTIWVTDNGRGIAEKDMHKVFKIFGRAGRQDVPGEGMGLPYVQTLIRRHGGRIKCRSEVGVGTTFSLTLPNKEAGKDPRG